MKNVLEMLEASCKQYGSKILITDEINSLSYNDVCRLAKNVGTVIAKTKTKSRAVAIYANQSAFSLVCMLGIVYSGNYYVVLDNKMPIDRIQMIINKVNPIAILTSNELAEQAACFNVPCIKIQDAVNCTANDMILQNIRSEQIETDTLYVLFTSGSTGVPKGTVISHGNVLAYSAWFSEKFGIDENTVFGNQTPFYFSMSVSDIYGCLRAAASIHIISKKLFSFPVRLIDYMNERKINTIYWVPSALSIVANMKALDVKQLPFIKKVLFAGEVMPAKQLNYWRNHIPDALYANLFGPTETTDICCCWVLNREICDDESVPIGFSCNNCDCMIIDENGHEADEGEMYVRGPFVAKGYFNEPQKTAFAFIQNPLNKDFPETVYRTGDIVRKNKYGEFEYISRCDFQIKRMGYRIETGEIEAAASAIDGVKICVVVYDKSTDCLALIYQGKKLHPADINTQLSEKLPHYMMPNMVSRIREIPYNSNGKIDRKLLESNFEIIRESELK